MTTPIVDFISRYAASGTARLHMPGHKGQPFLGCERFDITEIAGTENLIAESERNAAELFGSGTTLYSTEGSSQCVRAMVYLALLFRPGAPILAARNVHSSFVHAAALCGAEIVWLWPSARENLCECEVAPAALDAALKQLPNPPAAVYVTSPDYLGNTADIAGLAAVCRKYDTPLLVDNAHGAYFKFLTPSRHPLDQGAALCCDSAHKTLPVLTGGAYLHISREMPGVFRENAQTARALFSSTSPSWLTLASLDLCNRCLAEGYPARLAETVSRFDHLKGKLRQNGWQVTDSDPLRLTLRGNGRETASRLRAGGVEPEYADRDFCVLMATPSTTEAELARVAAALGKNDLPPRDPPRLPPGKCESVCTPRTALFSPRERVAVSAARGRICGMPAVSCPPAVPIVCAGERISEEAAALLAYYGAAEIDVLK